MLRPASSLRGGGRARAGWRRAGSDVFPLLVLLGLTGCNRGIHWQGPTFPDAQALARRDHRLTFVYFRSWYLVECTDFEEQTLKNPEVLAETRDIVCVVLDYDWDQPLAQQWRLKTVPAFAIVAPDGNLLVRQSAPITREELLRAIRSAKASLASGTQPVAAPPLIPP
jgi:hypothetical protein